MTDYTKLVEALTCGNDGKLPCHNNECPYWVDKWHGIGLCNVIIKDEDAAAAIEDLQAQLPKLGEWQKAKPKGVVTYSDGYAECSHCHETIWLGWGMNFCPNCGTQNRIIDPDDYKGAKMEVSE